MGTELYPASEVVYRFGLFTFDPAAGTLTRRGMRIKLQEQPCHFLALLLENRGAVVSRVAIRERLWPGNTFVDFDKSVGIAVLKVREALEDNASNPRFVETVPRRGYRFIAPVEVVEPAIFQNPATSAQTVPGFASFPPLTTTVWRWSAGIAIALCIVGVLSFGMFRMHSKRVATNLSKPPTSTASVVMRPMRSVAVLSFRSLPQNSQSDWLSTALSEMLNTELAAGRRLRMIPGEDVARVTREISLTPETTLSKSTLQQLRANLGADVVVLGSCTLLPNRNRRQIRLDVRMQDTELGETIKEDSFTGDEDDLFDLATRAGVQLRKELSPESSLAPVADDNRISVPSDRLALR